MGPVGSKDLSEALPLSTQGELDQELRANSSRVEEFTESTSGEKAQDGPLQGFRSLDLIPARSLSVLPSREEGIIFSDELQQFRFICG